MKRSLVIAPLEISVLAMILYAARRFELVPYVVLVAGTVLVAIVLFVLVHASIGKIQERSIIKRRQR